MSYKETTKLKLVELMKKCRKALLESIEGSDAEYAAFVGNLAKDAYLNLDKYTDSEIRYVNMNLVDYSESIDRLLSKLSVA